MRVNLCRRFAQTHKFRDVKKKILRTHLHHFTCALSYVNTLGVCVLVVGTFFCIFQPIFCALVKLMYKMYRKEYGLSLHYMDACAKLISQFKYCYSKHDNSENNECSFASFSPSSLNYSSFLPYLGNGSNVILY